MFFSLGNEKKILTLQCAGSTLENHWYLTDLGIRPGSTIKAVLIAQKKPLLYIYTVFDDGMIPITEKINVPRVPVSDVSIEKNDSYVVENWSLCASNYECPGIPP